MNYERIYQYRFKDVDMQQKQKVWGEIANFIYAKCGQPQVVLDPASGLCEFINLIPSREKWAVDMNAEFLDKYAEKSIRKVVGDSLQVSLPENYFDAVFISNFLEHLHSQEEVASFLEKMFRSLKRGGNIIIMGPNFKYVANEYFDFADHTVILSHLGLAEHVFGAGFTIKKNYPRFLPLSFRGGLPINTFLGTHISQLSCFFWPFFGKQFLLIAEK